MQVRIRRIVNFRGIRLCNIGSMPTFHNKWCRVTVQGYLEYRNTSRGGFFQMNYSTSLKKKPEIPTKLFLYQQ